MAYKKVLANLQQTMFYEIDSRIGQASVMLSCALKGVQLHVQFQRPIMEEVGVFLKYNFFK